MIDSYSKAMDQDHAQSGEIAVYVDGRSDPQIGSVEMNARRLFLIEGTRRRRLQSRICSNYWLVQ